ncbi:organic hydroperoxide resistance protein [Pseudoalteromonas sp. CNC9-20]|uniref:organic hydroperoxide resistance protein n=1 Tax=Pseudoalteromonas sp. CNC9-20 TaxID=2917750 RepID=UPI001EF71CD7|nr:organic hydroperoxide resistance protein [Pseudoalteromonas sp. CNC9-20]MCG7569534.1 organic hydroperoxide resistance protein [Pseudoalteromonas sp. CNC9-20]
MKTLNEVAYTAKVHTKGGREGHAQSDDGRLDVTLSTPKGLGGDDGQGTNPEQLFAAGYSACFIGAMRHVANEGNTSLPEGTAIDAQVSIGPIEGGFGIKAKLEIHLPDMATDEAQQLIEKAHQVCPYSNATRDNIEVQLVLKDA